MSVERVSPGHLAVEPPLAGWDELPDWLLPVARAARGARAADLTRLPTPPGEHRRAAVLILFGEGPAGPDLLLIERSSRLRSHAGQPAFPGGAVDPEDPGPIGAALREAEEETGLDPAGVVPFAVLPELFILPSRFLVTPVLAWWRRPSPVAPVDPAEVASVHRVPLAELLDPANRLCVRHSSGHVGPAFRVDGLVVWGFTGGVLSRLLALAGLELPWDASRVEELSADPVVAVREVAGAAPVAPARTDPIPTPGGPDGRAPVGGTGTSDR